ncbi:MAG: amidohydrolase family protein, partial [Woeseiaceae bacterium]
ERGQRTIEHLDNIAVSCSSNEAELQARPVMSFIDAIRRERDAFVTFDAAKCRRLAETFRENNTWMVPTLAVMLGSSSEVDHAANAIQWGQYLDADTLRWIIPTEETPSEDLKILQQAFENAIEVTAFLHYEGVSFLAGTDVMNPNTYPGFSIHDELELLVRAGFSTIDAIRAATINPAIFLGQENEFGSIESGKVADLVLLDADPLSDIGNTTEIFAVFVRGNYFDRARLDELLRSLRNSAQDN